MKKLLILSFIGLAVALSACNKNAVDDNVKADKEPVKEVLTGETNTYETAVATDSDFVNRIKRINPRATVEESVNVGLKMLKIDLPIFEEPDDKAEEFFEEVEDIVKKCNLQDSTAYDFYYFSTSKDGAVEITAAFKRLDGKLVLESVNGISELYKNAAEIAAHESRLFR